MPGVQSYCFAYQTYCFFDVLVATALSDLKVSITKRT